MKVSGFTFIRNAIKYDYPIVEAIKSILPICDEVVVAVGYSEDDTRNLISSISKEKVKIIDTQWDLELREGGRVLALETDKAFNSISDDADWAFYIQGDEVLHERYHDPVLQSMKQHLSNEKVEGLLFDYLHFYGSYDYVGASSRWYPNEIRVIRNNPEIFSYKDAQGFRKKPNDKLRVAPANASIYHYGWVKEPKSMQAKQESFHKFWHDDQWMDTNVKKVEEFDYSDIDVLKKFDQTHPNVMQDRISKKNWVFDHDPTTNRFSKKDKLKSWFKHTLGLSLGEYRNYHLIKP